MVAATLAQYLSSSEGAIKLLLTLLIGYPLAIIYRTKPIYTLPATVKHLIFVVIGLAISYYNFGYGVFHSLANITIVYLVLLINGGKSSSVIFLFIFNTLYLVMGYFFYPHETDFGISWTMPHCVLTLRLTGVAFDYYDGQKKTIAPEHKDSALVKCPSYLEMLSHTFYFGGYMVGPQFSMRRFQNFVNGDYSNAKTKEAPASVFPAMKRLIVGVCYIGVYHSIALCVPDAFLYSDDYDTYSFVAKSAFLLIWGKNALHKYVGVWLIQEGVLILMGISYNGTDPKSGEIKWDGCSNIKVVQLETGESFHHFIQSFNVNTNQWMAKYIFKRLRFLGSKLVSQLCTLFYLALWHGFQSGYYMCFFLELVYTNLEGKVRDVLSRSVAIGIIPDLSILSPLGRVIRKVVILYLWSYALVPFSLHYFNKWHPVYKANMYVGHFAPFIVLVLCSLVLTVLPKKHVTNGVHASTKGVDASSKGVDSQLAQSKNIDEPKKEL